MTVSKSDPSLAPEPAAHVADDVEVRDADVRDVEVLIVGAGFGGIAMAASLRRHGLTNFVLVERSADVGGTWRDNTYPGAACDVPSHLYSFSFAPNPTWTRSFSPQPEIQRYLQRTAREVGVYDHCVFNAELLNARWDASTQRWTVITSHGRFRARFLVGATGPLSDPSVPTLPGLATFAGPAFHSARWDHDVDLRGKKVAVIGTGASAIQFVPEIAPIVDQLYVHQRTAPWIIPRRDRALKPLEHWLFAHVPGVQRSARAAIYWGRESFVILYAKRPRLVAGPQRLARRHLNRQLADPVLRRRLTPDFAFGCKRVLISNDYYPALARPNVDVVTDAITEVRPHAIVTADGAERPVDAVIYATGFHPTDAPIAARIHDGAGRSLAAHWQAGMSALRGTTVPGFPNFFMIIGPNTGLGHTSMIYMIESQVSYIQDAIRVVTAGGLGSIAPRPDAVAAYNAQVQAKLAPTVWNSGGCRSWYLDASGRNTTLWPDFTFRFRAQTRRIDLSEYVSVPAGNVAAGAVTWGASAPSVLDPSVLDPSVLDPSVHKPSAEVT